MMEKESRSKFSPWSCRPKQQGTSHKRGLPWHLCAHTQTICPCMNIVSIFHGLIVNTISQYTPFVGFSSAHRLKTMEECLYLHTEEQLEDDQLPPSSPPIAHPSSPLTMLNESQSYPTSICTLSPLSSPPESPPLCSLILPTTFPAQRLGPHDAGSEDSFVLSSPIRNRGDTRCKAQKQQDEE
jgi:hypothetical protein